MSTSKSIPERRKAANPQLHHQLIPQFSQIPAAEVEVVPEALTCLLDRFGLEVVRVTKDLCLSNERISVLPSVMREFNMLQTLDISHNLFRNLPVTIMMEYFPNLQVLDVSYNRISDLASVQQLGKMDRLSELNLIGNPLIAVNHRSALLHHLIFEGMKPSKQRLNHILGYTESAGRSWSSFRQLKGVSRVISSESTSKMLISGIMPGNIPPSSAVKRLNSKISNSSTPIIYCDLNPAPVPRDSNFPYLTVLNDQPITKEDIDVASAYTNFELKDDERNAPKNPKDILEQKKKRPVLRGRRKQEQLEKDLEELQQAHRKARVDKALHHLLRHGVVEWDSGDEKDPTEVEPDIVLTGSDRVAEDMLGDVADAGVKKPPVSEIMHNRKAMAETEYLRWLEAKPAAVQETHEARTHRQGTCPAAWWDADDHLEAEAEVELPTRLTVVEQSAEELSKTRGAVDTMKELGQQIKEGEKLEYQEAKGKLLESEKRNAAATNSKGKQTKALTLEFADVLKAELDARREADRQFLEIDLPTEFRRMNVGQWLQGETNAVTITEEIDRLFTSTNIDNKVSSSDKSGQSALQIAINERKLAGQTAQQEFRERHGKHQDRLKVIAKGGWPKYEPVRPPQLKKQTESAADAAAKAEKELKSQTASLTKALDKMERSSGIEPPMPKEEPTTMAEVSIPSQPKLDKARKRFEEGDLKSEVDEILLDRTGEMIDRNALLVRRANLKEVRRELREFHERFVTQELRFEETRQNVGVALDKLIVERRFGEFGTRKLQLAGLEFDENVSS